MSYIIPLGITAKEHNLSPGESIDYLFDSSDTMLNITIRLDNANQYPTSDSVTVTIIDFARDFTTKYTLTSFRYGIYFDEMRINKIIITNGSGLATAEVYLEIMTKPVSEFPNEIAQFITQINTTSPPTNQSLYQGSNNRYTGDLAGATFLSGTPTGTPIAIRQISAQSTSSSAVGFVTISFAENLTFNANIEPLGILNYTTVFAFLADSITNALPSSATETDTTVNYIMIDYYFDYNLSVSFSSGYSIEVDGSETTINFSGNVLAYYYTNSSLPIPNASISSISESDSSYTLSPTSGTTNSSGLVPFSVYKSLDSTTTLNENTITASTKIAGITKSNSASFTPSFSYTILPQNGEGIVAGIVYGQTFSADSNNAEGNIQISQSITPQNSDDIILVGYYGTISSPITLTSLGSMNDINFEIGTAGTTSELTFSVSTSTTGAYLFLVGLNSSYISGLGSFSTSNSDSISLSSDSAVTLSIVCPEALVTESYFGNGTGQRISVSANYGGFFEDAYFPIITFFNNYNALTVYAIIYYFNLSTSSSNTYSYTISYPPNSGTYPEVGVCELDVSAISLSFQVTASDSQVIPNQTITFTCNNATVSPTSASTDTTGYASTTASSPNYQTTVTGSVTIAGDTKSIDFIL